MTKLITFYKERAVLVDAGRTVDIVCLDFSKAFNTVSRSIFIEKLRSMGCMSKQ